MILRPENPEANSGTVEGLLHPAGALRPCRVFRPLSLSRALLPSRRSRNPPPSPAEAVAGPPSDEFVAFCFNLR